MPVNFLNYHPMTNPFELLKLWLQDERENGAPNPQQAVLSTATDQGIPHARVVAIREMTENGLLFFTQRGTRKVKELKDNPNASIVFWLELQQREVIIEGIVAPLSAAENDDYWQSYPPEAQIRFYSYAPTSAQPIANMVALEDQKKHIERRYEGKPLPISPFYCGYRLKPSRMVFYAYRTDKLSDMFEYCCVTDHWTRQLLSP